MPPKSKDKPEKDGKKTGEKKRGGKTQLPAHELVNEQTKESYLVEIRELDSRLTRYQVKHDELSAKNEQYQQQFDQLSSEQQETVSLYTKTLEQRIDEISDLNDRIVGLQQVKDAERAMYERQLQQLRNEYKETKDHLIAENMVLGSNLTQLDDFRIRRKELAARLATLERQLQQQQESHVEDIQRLEMKHEQGKERLKMQMVERVHEVAADFRKTTNRAMADTTKRTIAENVAIEAQLAKVADRSTEVHHENSDLQQQIAVRRRNRSQFEMVQNDLAKDYISGCKLIQMLKEKSQSYQVAADNRMMKSEQCKQLQLEADVLNEKLDDTRSIVSQRSEQCEQLTEYLNTAQSELQAEEDTIHALKGVISKSADLLSRALIEPTTPNDNTETPTETPMNIENMLKTMLEIITSDLVHGDLHHQTSHSNVQSCDAGTASPSLYVHDAGTLSISRIDANESIHPSKTKSARSTKVTHRRTPSTIATQTSFVPENGSRQQASKLSVADMELLLTQQNAQRPASRNTLPPL